MTVRILHVLGCLALIAALVVLVLCVRRGHPNDDIIAPSAVERFRQAGRGDSRSEDEQLSPLVQEAQILAAYLNPPRSEPAAPPGPAQENKAVARTPEIKPANTSPKFKLHGISYRPSRPEDSMALVWQPDIGRRWVKEGAQLGHIVIVEISGDSVLCTDGTATRAMTLDLDRADTFHARNRAERPVAERTDETSRVIARRPPVRRVRHIPRTRTATQAAAVSQDMDADTENP